MLLVSCIPEKHTKTVSYICKCSDNDLAFRFCINLNSYSFEIFIIHYFNKIYLHTRLFDMHFCQIRFINSLCFFFRRRNKTETRKKTKIEVSPSNACRLAYRVRFSLYSIYRKNYSSTYWVQCITRISGKKNKVNEQGLLMDSSNKNSILHRYRARAPLTYNVYSNESQKINKEKRKKRISQRQTLIKISVLAVLVHVTPVSYKYIVISIIQ